MAQDEAAVVRGRHVAGGSGLLVGANQHALAEHLRRLATTEARSVRDLDNHPALDDHQRVGAGNDRIGPVREAFDDRIDRPPEDVVRQERAHRIVDHDHVIGGGRKGTQAVPGALVAAVPAGHDTRRDLVAHRGQQALGLVNPPRMGDDHELVDPCRDEGLHAPKEDLLPGEPEELLGDLASESVPVSAREQDRGDEH